MKTQRGLSPLVASTILVVIAIVGGIMLYQYYSTLMTSLSTSSETLIVKRVRIITVDNTTAMAYIDLWNPSAYTAKVFSITIDSKYNITVNTTIPPASTSQLIVDINRTSIPTLEPGTKHYVAVAYELKSGLIQYTDIYQVIVE